ncbi:xanthine dehydrogenase family protein molybdopterin-binding subunit [Litoribrevibacter albus]|uniref:Oxidoreductase subunit beta n=1 Tax=Litoribrevibacter albus TaxID=1473156 RepID=A0AA37W973_9GAMM|nr:molybdopterin cofactor-binding domain-containing protein [Litoribrevibacter albus]GLQ32411.1 oxidoreductase subunit beta [Litoribrevibacter albus]
MSQDLLTAKDLTRRDFMKVSALAGGGLVVATSLLACSNKLVKDQQTGLSNWTPDAWLKLFSDGTVEFTLDRVEMGQGTYTGITTLLAEELDLQPDAIKVVFAPASTEYRNPDYGLQLTGGSNSISSSWQPIRETGASVRYLMKRAAARVWQIEVDLCDTDNGRVTRKGTNQSLSYAELLTVAAKESLPWSIPLKSVNEFKYIGKQSKRLDSPLKSTGKANFGIDTKIDGMAYASVVRSPVIGGRVKSFDASNALSSAGVVDVVEIQTGVAVVADSYWRAKKAATQLNIVWDEGSNADLSTAKVFDTYRSALAEDEGDSRRDVGNFSAIQSSGVKRLNVEYAAPFLAHATMEPQNCVAQVTKGRCDIWAPTQAPDVSQIAVAKATDLSLDQIFIHTTFIGGGFGRRLTQDFVAEAAEISAKTQRPIKLVWSREEDTQHDLYRPASLHQLEAVISDQGDLVGWQHRIACPKILSWYVWDAAPAQFPWAPKFMYNTLAKTGLAGEGVLAPEDHSPFEGAESYPYQVPNIDVRYTHADAGVPVSYWRSVGHSQNAFVVEGFMNEVADASGKDPYEFRRQLLQSQPRALTVLDRVVDISRWKSKPAQGTYRGLAIHQSFGSWVAQVVEVSVQGTQYQVEKVYCVVDCGLVVNPEIVQSQMESGIIFALTAAKYGRIDIEQGRVKQSNFHDYQILRMNETPEIEVDIVPSAESPTGVGEPGVPPLAPALADALFKATGQRLRQLPLELAS